ncbi:hypothetical protein [Bacillus pumilus]|uniref:hypothetical protein n=1 Tax=Bacillus pumilus TaxID=1408 RepID=UPI0011AAF465|nr:hypothetical protein [Bacillus pumilus]
MRFDIKKPCVDCPFLEDSRTFKTLSKNRLKGIIKDIRDDSSFTCHKTLELPSAEQQHCGGALIFLEREESPNQIMRIAERIGLYDHHSIDMNCEVITDEVVDKKV